jgi:hypothetical protein
MASYKAGTNPEGISLLNRCMDMLGTDMDGGKRTAPKEGTLVDFGMGVEIQYTPALGGSRDNVQSLVDDVNMFTGQLKGSTSVRRRGGIGTPRKSPQSFQD